MGGRLTHCQPESEVRQRKGARMRTYPILRTVQRRPLRRRLMHEQGWPAQLCQTIIVAYLGLVQFRLRGRHLCGSCESNTTK